MKRKKKKKKKPAYKSNYTQADVNKALEAVEKGTSTWKAAALHNVPRSTLYSKSNGRIPVEAVKGPKTVLTKDKENTIVAWIMYCSVRGFPVTRSNLLDCVKKLVLDLQRENPFTNDRPGNHWFQSFCRRHKEITQRVVQNLNTSRASATEIVLRKWFGEVHTHLTSLNILNIDSNRIYNLDESAFF